MMIKNVLNVLSISSVSVLIRLVSETLIARILAVGEFGLYAILISLISLIQVLLSGGVRPIIQRKLAIIVETTNSSEFYKVLAKSLVLLVLTTISVILIIEISPHFPIETELLRIIKENHLLVMVGALATSGLYIVADVFRVIGNFKAFVFYREALSQILLLTFIAIAWIFSVNDVNHIVLLYVASIFISMSYAGFSLQRELGLQKVGSTPVSENLFTNRELLLFWISSAVLGAVWILREKYAILSVAEFLNPSDIAMLYVMIRIMTPLNMIKSAFNNIISPTIAQLYHSKAHSLLNTKYRELTASLFLAIYPTYVLIVIFGPSIAKLLLGDDYLVDEFITSLLAWSISVSCLLGPSGVVFQMTGKPNVETIFLSVSLIFISVLTAVFVPTYGLIGSIVSVYFVISLFDFFRYLYIRILINIKGHEAMPALKIAFLMFGSLTITLVDEIGNNFGFALLSLIFVMIFCSEIRNIFHSLLKDRR